MNLFLTQGTDPAQSGSLISLLGMVAVFGVIISLLFAGISKILINLF